MKNLCLCLFSMISHAILAQTTPLYLNDLKPLLEAPPLDRNFQQHQQNNHRKAQESIIIDYSFLDEIATTDSGGTQEAFAWSLNSGFPDDAVHHYDLNWAAVTWDTLVDAVSFTAYPRATTEITVDSFNVLFLHDHVTGIMDTDMIILNMWSYVEPFGLNVDSNNEITGSQLLHTDTFYTTTSLAPSNGSNFGTLVAKPNLTLPIGERFTTEVRFYGDTVNTFYVYASYKDICFQACAAEPSIFKDNTFAKTIWWEQGQSLTGITNSLFFDCDQSGGQTPGSCESFYIQNLSMQAYLTLSTNLTASITARPRIINGSPCGGGVITLDANIASNSGDYSVTWTGTIPVDSPSAAITTVTIPSTGSYTFTVQAIDNIEEDTSIQDISINASNVPYAVDAGNNTNLGCTGGSTAGLQASVTTGNGAGSSYLWSNGRRSPSIFAVPGTYTVTATDAGGCLTATDEVTVFGNLDIDFSLQHESCGSDDGSISATVTGGIGPLNYAWNNGGTTSNISGLSAGTYILSVTDTSNCNIVDSLTVLDSCGIISGYVYNDVNGNGVMDVGEQAVAGTEILAFGGPAACVNSTGYYEMIVPSYGTYTITVDTPYRYYCFNSIYLPDELITPATGSYSITLNSGNPIATGIDFGLRQQVTPCGEVSGHVFEDSNGNSIKDPGELGLSAQTINVDPVGYTFTDPAGNYSSEVPYNQQLDISIPPMSSSYFCGSVNNVTQTLPTNPSFYTTMVTVANPVSGNHDFGLSTGANFDVGVFNVSPSYNIRPCQNFQVWMDWKTSGLIPTDCYLILEFDSAVSFVSAIHPVDTVGHNFIGWHFPAGAITNFDCYGMEFFLDCGPDPLPSTLSFTGRWSCGNADGCPQNDELTRTVNISGIQKRTTTDSDNAIFVYHQNDEERYAIEHADSSFSYVIIFKNTTNDTAYNMTVVDTLPPYFQLNTVSYPFSNKPFTFRVKEENILVWQFNNINLPPARDNRLASNGFIQFNVIMQPHLPHGTLFENRAAITYNYSNTFVTNTAENLLTLVGTSTDHQNEDVTVYPNPSQGIFEIVGFAKAATSWQIDLYDVKGALIMEQHIGDQESLNVSFDVSRLSGGIYLLKVQNGFTITTKKIVIQ